MLTKEIIENIRKIRGFYVNLLNQNYSTKIYRGNNYDNEPNESLVKECHNLTEVFKYVQELDNINIEIDKNEEEKEKEKEKEIIKLIEEEIKLLKQYQESVKSKIEKSIFSSIITDNTVASKNIIIEIRPGAGGNEAGIFVEDLYRMYNKFVITNNWKNEVLNFTPGNIIGSKEIIFSISNKIAYSYMKYESGVHRVQRIPKTESKGRIHTSTVTVTVLPEIEEIDLKIDENELRIDFFRSSGPGGQSVNTTDSAVRITHIPTGISVASQVERSQHKNREIAMRILRAKLFDFRKYEKLNEQSKMRKDQIGTGNRNEKIRTYNFPQNRITDHRYDITINNLTEVMEGKLEILLEKIIDEEINKTLKEFVKKCITSENNT